MPPPVPPQRLPSYSASGDAIKFLAIAGVILMAGLFVVAAVAPSTETAPPSAAARSVPPVLSMAEVLAGDVLTGMGRIAERDSHHFLQKFYAKNPDWKAPPSPPMEKVKVNPQLTAEQVFEANEKDRPPQMPGFPNWDVCKDGCWHPPIDARALPESEGVRLRGLYRIHNMASLVLYKEQCNHGGAISGVDLIARQFRQLPMSIQTKALDHETTAIAAIKPFDSTEWNVHLPGGWARFCSAMSDHSIYRSDRLELDAMFATAEEVETKGRAR
jgi:hypothetical protein